MKNLRQKIKNLPETPGVYIYRNQKGEILYIGKATSLKSRVGSYFSGAHNDRIEKMVEQISDLEIKKTDSVLEALILESNLIKKYKPKYNVQLKDDKSFSYFAITQEKFPRVLILRETDLTNPNLASPFPKGRNGRRLVFGPYTSKKQMAIALKIIRRIFPFHALKAQTEKSCLDFELGLCPGPYAEAISQKEYQKNIQGIRLILEGKKGNLIRKLKKEMTIYAKAENFEKAGVIRNQIFALQYIQDVALIAKEEKIESREKIRIEAYDISNISGDFAVGSMVVFSGENPDKSQYRKFKIKTVSGSNDVAMMREVLTRRFQNDWPLPQLILLDGGLGHLNMAEKIIKSFNLDIPLVAIAKGPERKKTKVIKNLSGIVNSEISAILDNPLILKRIMDEAHRFAITFHKKVRRRSFLEDSLQR